MKPFVVRAVEEKALPDLKKLAGSIKGLTTLPDDLQILQNRIDDSLKAFHPRVRKPGGESYLFVVESLESGEAVGTSGIVSKVGGFDPFYTYKIVYEHLESADLNVCKDMRILHLHTNHNGPTEIGSLFVSHRFRRHGLGRLVSLSRFLFMAELPKRFDEVVISELRGPVNAEGNPPFWECVGRHFFDTDFYHADYLTGTGNKDVIASLMPRYPIYVDLLPNDAQEVIGKVHRDTVPARALLENEGFAFHDEVDIFDAGPTVTAVLENVRTVKASRKAKIYRVLDAAITGDSHLISNGRLDFRCVQAGLHERADGLIEVDAETAKTLLVSAGDEIRYVTTK